MPAPSEIAPSATTTPSGTSEAPVSLPDLRQYPDPLRRLSAKEYQSSVQDVLGGAPDEISLPADETVGAFTSNSLTPVSTLHIDNYDLAATRIAETANLGQLIPCTLAAASDACVQSFINTLGARLYRRPLSADEIAGLVAVQKLGSEGTSFETGLRLALKAMLSSPDFLYLVEAAEPGSPTHLSAHSLGARLSYFLWGSTPDPELSALADSGGLLDPATWTQQLERLQQSPRAKAQIERFHVEWLGLRRFADLDKDLARFPAFTPALQSAMQHETASFSNFVIQESDAKLSTLLSAPFSVVEEPLLQVYGLANSPNRDAELPLALNPVQRAGLLTEPAVLAMHSHRDTTSPVHRGIFVFKNLLCETLAPPPAGVTIPSLSVIPGTQQTKRAILGEHEANPACGGCHRLVDPIGLAFENYDALGAYRAFDPDEQRTVDASATLATGTDLDGTYANALELIARLSQSEAVARCVVQQWFRFALGRTETSKDAAVLEQLQARFKASDHDIRDLMAVVATSDAFRQRPNRSVP